MSNRLRRLDDRLGEWRAGTAGNVVFASYFIGVIVVVAVAILLLLRVNVTAQNALDAARRAQETQCSQKRDYSRRLTLTRALRKAYPEGLPGYTTVAMDAAVAELEAEVVALKDVEC